MQNKRMIDLFIDYFWQIKKLRKINNVILFIAIISLLINLALMILKML